MTTRGKVTASPPPAAVMRIVKLPVRAVALARSVNVLVPAPGAARLEGEYAAVTPLGRLAAVSVIPELNPFATVVVRSTVTLAPCKRLTDDALPVIVKLGGGAIVTASEADCDLPPPVALT